MENTKSFILEKELGINPDGSRRVSLKYMTAIEQEYIDAVKDLELVRYSTKETPVFKDPN